MPVAINCCTDRQKRLWESLRVLPPPVDAMLVTSPHNLRYLTGFTGSNGLAIVTASQTYFFTDPRYQFQAAKEVTAKVKVLKGPLLQHAATMITERKWRRLGVEPDHLTLAQLETLQSQCSKRQMFVPR